MFITELKELQLPFQLSARSR